MFVENFLTYSWLNNYYIIFNPLFSLFHRLKFHLTGLPTYLRTERWTNFEDTRRSSLVNLFEGLTSSITLKLTSPTVLVFNVRKFQKFNCSIVDSSSFPSSINFSVILLFEFVLVLPKNSPYYSVACSTVHVSPNVGRGHEPFGTPPLLTLPRTPIPFMSSKV